MTVFPDSYYAAIEQRAHTDAVPPAGFDPLKASAAELAAHGLPARPDASSEPMLLEFWTRLLSPPFTFVVPEFPKRPPTPLTGPRILRQAARLRAGGSGIPPFASFAHREQSLNWSGAYITPRPSRCFSFMAGAWTVPTPAVPTVPPIDADNWMDYRSSTWIGFGGHRGRYPRASLPQIGSRQHIIVENGGTSTTYEAWWQWWKRSPDPVTDPPNEPVVITNMRLHPGDEILACMFVTPPTPGDVRFVIKNQATGIFCTFIVTAPGAVDPVGSTAEWIMERPTETETLKTHPMPNCTDVTFRYCIAQAAADLVAPPVTQTLAGNARFINMYERFANPHRSAIVSKARKTGETTTVVSYTEAGALPGA